MDTHPRLMDEYGKHRAMLKTIQMGSNGITIPHVDNVIEIVVGQKVLDSKGLMIVHSEDFLREYAVMHTVEGSVYPLDSGELVKECRVMGKIEHVRHALLVSLG